MNFRLYSMKTKKKKKIQKKKIAQKLAEIISGQIMKVQS